MAGRNSLDLAAGGGGYKLLAAVVSDVTNAGDVYGDDTINGGIGDDTIFGDDGRITADQGTGFAVIDANLAGLSLTMQNLMVNFASLGFANNALTHTGPMTTVKIGADTINGDAGNDMVFGDTGTVIVPCAPAGARWRQRPGRRAGHERLRVRAAERLRRPVLHRPCGGHEGGGAVRGRARRITRTYNPKNAVLIGPTHKLELGNDIIDGGAGADMLVGDHGITTIPSIMVTRANPTKTYTTAQKTAMDAALAAQDTTLTNALNAHITRDHKIDASANAGANWLFGNQLGYMLKVGSDTIGGGADDDVIIGDTGVLERPVLLQGYTAAQAKAIADQIQNTFLNTVDALFNGNIAQATAQSNAFGVIVNLNKAKLTDWSAYGAITNWLTNLTDPRQSKKPGIDYITLNADIITGGAGNDIAIGDNGQVMPIVNGAGAAGTPVSYRILPIGEPRLEPVGNAALHL